MDSNSNNTKSIKRKVVDQLVEGYEFATQLQLLLSRHQHSNHRSVSGDPDPVDELLAKILGSFHNTISVLDSYASLPVAVEGSRNASCGDDSAAPASCNGGDTGDSKKRLGVSKSKRGCYTRKKRSHTWTVEARRIEDSYAWRKYGQKDILNTKFPRSYFRCTHKPTQGCKATKQVQKQEQNPDMFQITYIGHHTCNATDQSTEAKTEPFEIIMDSHNKLPAHQDHVQEQENNISSVTVVKEEDNNFNGDQNKEYCEASSTCEDLSLVWQDCQDMMMLDDTTSNHFGFFDNDHLSSLLLESYSAYEGTRAI